MNKIQEFIKNFKTLSSEENFRALVQKESTNLLHELNKRKFGSWKSKFISDIYQERIMYPHEEMEASKKAFMYNAFIQAAVNSLRDFITGGELKASSEHKPTEDWINEQLRKTGLGVILQTRLASDITVYGNFYVERHFNGKNLVAYSYVSVPEKIYHDLDNKGMLKRYIQELPAEQLRGTNFVTIQYYGDRRRTVKGIEIAKNKLSHIKMGVSNIECYGRGPVASVVNDFEILVEVERAMAVIARYKAIPKKLLMLQNANGPKDAQFLANQLSNVGDDENPISPFEIQIGDLSYSGKDLNVQPIVDYLKRKMTVALAPSFMIHGEETRYANSKEQRISFELRINTIRSVLSQQIKKEIRLIAKSYNKQLREFEVEFGTYDIGQKDEDRLAAVNLFNAGVITLNEARELLDLEEDKENGEFYSFELKSTQDTLMDTNAEPNGEENKAPQNQDKESNKS